MVFDASIWILCGGRGQNLNLNTWLRFFFFFCLNEAFLTSSPLRDSEALFNESLLKPATERHCVKYLSSVFIFIFMIEIFFCFLNRKKWRIALSLMSFWTDCQSKLGPLSLYVAVLTDQEMNCIAFYWHLWWGAVWGVYWPSSSLSDLHQSQKQDWCTITLNIERWVGTSAGQKGTPFWDTWASPPASRSGSALRKTMGDGHWCP